MCVAVCGYVPTRVQMPVESRRGCLIPNARVTDSCKPPMGGTETKLRSPARAIHTLSPGPFLLSHLIYFQLHSPKLKLCLIKIIICVFAKFVSFFTTGVGGISLKKKKISGFTYIFSIHFI